jgi:2,4-didehydro-3-deoxy-L-rhamnonate hydrolase
MRIANMAGRLAVIHGDRAVDVAEASDGRFGPSVQGVYDGWDDFVQWGRKLRLIDGRRFELAELGAPVPAPTQVFGIGLNYPRHVDEKRSETPRQPVVFTKFPSCITAPHSELSLPAGDVFVDWEVELVVVIGRYAHRLSPHDAWSHVAGVTVGQDLSERHQQFAGPSPQFSLAKSFPGFGPIGPVLVTLDEFDDPDDLVLGCHLNGEEVQRGRTGEMVFSVPEIIAALSAVVPLLPGDVIFTGSPPGVGVTMDPARRLRAGDVLVSSIEGIGEIRQDVRTPTSA